MTDEIPDDPDERIDWIVQRAAQLDFIRGENWIREEIEHLWENPDEFEVGETYEVPDGVDEEDYALFQLALCFGTDYEHHYPRGDD